ncbi:MAG: hypothetical protein ACI93R_002712 [Flavobacteriales bacterium]|jgi:hypothetical protein
MTGHTLTTGRAATLIKLAFAAGEKLSAAFIAFGLTALVTRNMANDAWPRRISGVLSNELTNRHPNPMHLILTPKSQSDDAYQVSIRAAKTNPVGADTLAKKFGGRERLRGLIVYCVGIEKLWDWLAVWCVNISKVNLMYWHKYESYRI